MSKSKYNVVNPDEVIDQYGADCFRMYEMFLGPIEHHKPWDTKGIDGVAKFLRRFWKAVIDKEGNSVLSNEEPGKQEWKILFKTLDKIDQDVQRLSFNTAVSAFMICLNELSSLGAPKKAIFEPLIIALCPFAPHIAEEMWSRIGGSGFVVAQELPAIRKEFLVEDAYAYPVSINGKVRTKVELPLDLSKDQVEAEVLKLEVVQKWLDGSSPKKVIVVPGRIVNVVV